jgi:hypothetical protein
MRNEYRKHDEATPLGPSRLVDAWRGHFPITSIALLSILNRAAAGQEEFSQAERILYVACEFWAAVNALELEAHVDLDVADALHDARFAFSAIGAEHLVNTLLQVDAPTGDRMQDGHRQWIATLQEQLLRVADSVDVLIARFARRCLFDELGLAEPAPGLSESHRYYEQLLA